LGRDEHCLRTSETGGVQVNNAAVGNLNAFTAELAIRDVKINYEGTKNLTETLLPLLKHSDAGARIVILSSLHGQLVVSISALGPQDVCVSFANRL